MTGDFNGDGRLDLAVADDGNLFWGGTDPPEVIVLLGNGDGTFQAPERFAAGSDTGTEELVAGDFTGDGRIDLAAFNYGSDGISVFLANGDGTFQPEHEIAIGARILSLVAGDWNGDGRTDLAAALPGYFEGDGNISVFLANNDGTFQPQVTYAVGSFPGGIVAGDFTGDGRLDLVVSDDDGAQLLLGNGDGIFQSPSTDVAGAGVLTGDFNDDGRSDLVIAGSNSLQVLSGNGDGTFTDPTQFAAAAYATPLVGDFNGDGTDDVLVVDGAGDILYRQGQPLRPGSFDPPVTINSGFPSHDIAWMPNTSVGPVLASVDAHDDAISLYAYRDGGFVRLRGSLATGRLPAQIIAADLTGGGLTDLVVRNAGDGTLSVYYGTEFDRNSFPGPPDPYLSLPSFLPTVSFFAGMGVSDLQAVDTTGHGRLDLVVTNKLTAQVSILRNVANGIFAPPERYRAGTGAYALDDSSGSPQVTEPGLLKRTAGPVRVAGSRPSTGRKAVSIGLWSRSTPARTRSMFSRALAMGISLVRSRSPQ